MRGLPALEYTSQDASRRCCGAKEQMVTDCPKKSPPIFLHQALSKSRPLLSPSQSFACFCHTSWKAFLRCTVKVKYRTAKSKTKTKLFLGIHVILMVLGTPFYIMNSYCSNLKIYWIIKEFFIEKRENLVCLESCVPDFWLGAWESEGFWNFEKTCLAAISRQTRCLGIPSQNVSNSRNS